MFKMLKNHKITNKRLESKNFISPKYFCFIDFEYKSDNQALASSNKIVELKKLGDYLFLLSNEGSLFIYSTHSHKNKISSLERYLNSNIFGGTDYLYKAKSIYLNKKRQTLVIVYLNKAQNYTEMKCCELNYNSLKLLARFLRHSREIPKFRSYFEQLFEQENLSGNCFIEFDEFNDKILTKDAHNVFKVWDLKDYRKIFILSDSRVDEVRTTYNVLMTLEMNNQLIKLKTYDINKGNIIINYDIKISSEHSIEILELFESYILIKQQIFKPVLFNLETNHYFTIENDNFSVNSHFIYNYKSKIIVAINQNNLQFYRLNGEHIRTIDRVVKNLVEDFVQCSNDFKYLFFYYPNKIPEKQLDKSFVQERSHNDNYDSFHSDKSRFFTKSIQKEIEMISVSHKSCEKFLNSISNSITSGKDKKNSFMQNSCNNYNEIDEISSILTQKLGKNYNNILRYIIRRI